MLMIADGLQNSSTVVTSRFPLCSPLKNLWMTPSGQTKQSHLPEQLWENVCVFRKCSPILPSPGLGHQGRTGSPNAFTHTHKHTALELCLLQSVVANNNHNLGANDFTYYWNVACPTVQLSLCSFVWLRMCHEACRQSQDYLLKSSFFLFISGANSHLSNYLKPNGD